MNFIKKFYLFVFLVINTCNLFSSSRLTHKDNITFKEYQLGQISIQNLKRKIDDLGNNEAVVLTGINNQYQYTGGRSACTLNSLYLAVQLFNHLTENKDISADSFNNYLKTSTEKYTQNMGEGHSSFWDLTFNDDIANFINSNLKGTDFFAKKESPSNVNFDNFAQKLGPLLKENFNLFSVTKPPEAFSLIHFDNFYCVIDTHGNYNSRISNNKSEQSFSSLIFAKDLNLIIETLFKVVGKPEPGLAGLVPQIYFEFNLVGLRYPTKDISVSNDIPQTPKPETTEKTIDTEQIYADEEKAKLINRASYLKNKLIEEDKLNFLTESNFVRDLEWREKTNKKQLKEFINAAEENLGQPLTQFDNVSDRTLPKPQPYILPQPNIPQPNPWLQTNIPQPNPWLQTNIPQQPTFNISNQEEIKQDLIKKIQILIEYFQNTKTGEYILEVLSNINSNDKRLWKLIYAFKARDLNRYTIKRLEFIEHELRDLKNFVSNIKKDLKNARINMKNKNYDYIVKAWTILLQFRHKKIKEMFRGIKTKNSIINKIKNKKRITLDFLDKRSTKTLKDFINKI